MSKEEFTREDLDIFLKELGKEFRKRNGRKTPAEMILVGGASVLINYGFREMTTDIDAVIQASSAMKEAIAAVGDRFGLPGDWLNTDFTKTTSFSRYLVQYSRHYKTYGNILEIRTVCAEYLLAMKLVSGRKYKKDMSDIIGIIMEERKRGNEITYEQVDRAMQDLYGGWDRVDEQALRLLKQALVTENLDELFDEQQEEEKANKQILIEFREKYPQQIKGLNINDVIQKAKEKEAEHERKGTL